MLAATILPGAQQKQSAYADPSSNVAPDTFEDEDQGSMDLDGDDHVSLPHGDGRELAASRPECVRAGEGGQDIEEEQSISAQGHSQDQAGQETINRNKARRQVLTLN